MNNLQVVIAKPVDFNTLVDSQGKAYDVASWKPKAAWQLLRFLYGYKTADQMIKEKRLQIQKQLKKLPPELQQQKKGKISAAVELLKEVDLEDQPLKQPLQFIIENYHVLATATLKHLLIPPEQVYATAREIMKEIGYPLKPKVRLAGEIYILDTIEQIQRGIQISAGDLITDHAIRVASFMRIMTCLNPLSWLGATAFTRFLGYAAGGWERIVRIKVIKDLEPRLKFAITNQLKRIPELDFYIKRSKKRKLKRSDAIMLAVAFGSSYSIGNKVVQQVLEKYESEDQTIYGLAQAFSYIAAHGKTRATPEKQTPRIHQNLSSVAAAMLLIEDYDSVKDNTLQWIKKHIKKGKLKTFEELLQEAKLIKS